MRTPEPRYVFRLFLIEKSKKSGELIKALRHFFEERLREDYTLEIVDILENPDLTLQHHIMASPTLIKEAPPPQKRMIGSILNQEKLLSALE